MEKITILLADDHTIFREGLRSLLEFEEGMEVVGEASNGKEAVELAIKLNPDVIIMDITMPEINGLQAAYQIQTKIPSIKIIVLSMSDNEEFVTQAIQAGVCGYLVKQSAANELITAITEVYKGNAYFSAPISKILLEKQRFPNRRSSGLTLREQEVLQFVAQGRTNKEISSLISISVKTVEKYRQQIMDKLKIHDVANLTRYAISKGIIK